MENKDRRSRPSNEAKAKDARKSWEQPALRRLDAKQALGGGNPGNDGKGGGPGSPTEHS